MITGTCNVACFTWLALNGCRMFFKLIWAALKRHYCDLQSNFKVSENITSSMVPSYHSVNFNSYSGNFCSSTPRSTWKNYVVNGISFNIKSQNIFQVGSINTDSTVQTLEEFVVSIQAIIKIFKTKFFRELCSQRKRQNSATLTRFATAPYTWEKGPDPSKIIENAQKLKWMKHIRSKTAENQLLNVLELNEDWEIREILSPGSYWHSFVWLSSPIIRPFFMNNPKGKSF